MLFVFVVATLNLAVGYVLGVAMTTGDPLDAFRLGSGGSATPADEEVDDGEMLTRPPQGDAADGAPAESEADEPLDAMTGLAHFREKLAMASVELKLTQEDTRRFNACASRLQEANHGYVDHATAAAEEMKQRGEAGEAGAEEASKVISAGAEEAAKLSGEFDELLQGDLTSEAKAELIDRASAMKETATKTQLASESAMAEPVDEPDPSPPSDEPKPESAEKPNDGPVLPIDELFEQLQAMLAAADAEAESSRIVGSISADPVEGQESDVKLYDALAHEVDALLRETLKSGEKYANGAGSEVGRPVIAFGDQSFEEASKTIELVRQSFEATQFRRGDDTFRATITCALVEATADVGRDAIEQQLSEALEESERSGHNRTFHHDGAFATALPSLPVEAATRSVTIT